MTVVKLLALCMVLLALVTLEVQISNIKEERNDLDGRLIYVESHFLGHRAIAVKNGTGLRIEPCDLGTDDCIRDDIGISLTNMIISGHRGDGVNIKNQRGIVKGED